MERGRALTDGDSGGIGAELARHCRKRLGDENVTDLSRSADGLDVTSEASVDAALGPLDGPYTLVFIATGALRIAVAFHGRLSRGERV